MIEYEKKIFFLLLEAVTGGGWKYYNYIKIESEVGFLFLTNFRQYKLKHRT